ncbi:hypothetical protein [Methylocystis sp. S23]
MAGAVDIPFPTISSPGERKQLSGGRLVNAILEEIEGGKIIRKRAPGLRRFITSADGNAHCRGMIDANSGTLLVVYDGVVEAVTGSGSTSTVLGALPGSDIVTLSKNNATTPQIVCVSPATGAYVLTAGALRRTIQTRTLKARTAYALVRDISSSPMAMGDASRVI